MKSINKYLIIILLILIISLTGCSNKSENTEDLKQKVKAELSYINEETIDLMNRLNNISFSNYLVSSKEVPTVSEVNSSTSGEDGESSGQEKQVNSASNPSNIKVTEMVESSTISTDYNNIKWDELQANSELFVSTWNSIILDLYKIGINGNDITEFSSYLDNLLLAIKKQDKISALNNIAVLYSYIPKYIEAFDGQSFDKDLYYTKLHILNAYVGATAGNWDYSNTELRLAEESFSNVMNNNEFIKTREYNINKTYVTIKEMQNSLKFQDFTIFIIKYKNAMQEIGILG